MRAFSQQTTASLLLLLPALFSLIPTALAAVDTNTLSGLMQDPNFFHKIQGCKQTFTEHAAAAQIRAAFHDAGTFSTQDNSGGADGSLQTEDELQRKDNTWIRPAINYLKPFVSDGVSMSDLIALAGVGAVKACGGPRIDFYAGRKDGASPNPTGRLPGNESTVTEIKSMFARMGLSVRDTVALAGAHTVGGIRLNNNFARLDFVPFDSTPTIFDNQIFKEILDGTARMAFNLDLATDPETRPIVEE
ncbi:L-ascorbate peroxidase 3 [Quaeritorhiza haematococci]|nr:L-ascorbate peroxidase 3 [Quaeritorhiza haematococci]